MAMGKRVARKCCVEKRRDFYFERINTNSCYILNIYILRESWYYDKSYSFFVKLCGVYISTRRLIYSYNKYALHIT